MISIHALREEGDTTLLRFVNSFFISIHALREEGDAVTNVTRTHVKDFYPRPPRGGRHRRCAGCHNGGAISIHALREEGDRWTMWPDVAMTQFLSTPSARRATLRLFQARVASGISIHALREEGDHSRRCRRCGQGNFYPRPPRGGRQREFSRRGGMSIFLSTPSARRATWCRTAPTWPH